MKPWRPPLVAGHPLNRCRFLQLTASTATAAAKLRRLPGNVVVGINRAYRKLFRLALATTDQTAATAPDATLLLGPADSAAVVSMNPGLLLAPWTMAAGGGNTLLVLETSTDDDGSPGTLRAFNTNGRPVAYFQAASGAALTHAITLADAGGSLITHLDLRVEDQGYVARRQLGRPSTARRCSRAATSAAPG